MWSFHFILSYLGTNPHHFFPTLPRVGHDPFAVAAVPVSVTFHCCEIFLPLSSTKAVSFDVGQLRNVPAGTGAEPVSAFPRRCHPGLGRWHFVPDTRGPYACRTGSSVCIYEHKERCQVLFVIIQLENITWVDAPDSPVFPRGPSQTSLRRIICLPTELPLWPLCICERHQLISRHLDTNPHFVSAFY